MPTTPAGDAPPPASHHFPLAAPPAGDALIIARWPAPAQAVDEGALAAFDALKGLVRAVRNARAEYGVEEKRRVAATLVVADAGLRLALEAEIQVRVCVGGRKEARTEGVWD